MLDQIGRGIKSDGGAVEEGGREEERDGWCAAGNETTKQGCAHYGAMKSRQHTTENYLKGDTGKDRVT